MLQSSRSHRTTRTLVVAAAAAALGLSGLAVAPTASARPTAAETKNLPGGRYIVLLDEPAAATYAGGVDGYAATRAAKGEKFRADRPVVREYRNLLRDRQAAVAAGVGATRSQSYTVANNGFAASLTSAQATELSSVPGVLAVVEDRLAKPDTTSSPEFLGLTKGGQAVAPWSKTGAGKGVVVGVIDSGYWPENPSFAGTAMPTASNATAASGPVRIVGSSTSATQFVKADGGTFNGRCETGEDFPATTCNSKVISADAFGEGFRSAVKRSKWGATEYDSPRDGGGHGSHTASTAAGNSDVEVIIDGVGFGKASGMAPASKIAVYKVCWEAQNPAQTGCYNSDTAAAIDQSVADGVDVINYSISGTRTDVVDPVEIGFLNAAAAGIFVAASAGNSGPAASTVAHNSPWLTTVAASTHVVFDGTVVLGNGAAYKGSSTTADGTNGSLVLSTAAVAARADATQGRLCYPGTLDPAKVSGKIVVCDRGVIARVDKSAAVKAAGGIGMVLANTSDSSLDADLHTVPTVHVDNVAGAAIKAYVASVGTPTATLAKGDQTGSTSPTPVPQIAGFSSRGPALAAGGDLLKPDISAPGVSVIAAVAPPSNSGRNWDFYSGTSMSSPHVAGLAAFYLSKFPLWSPMAVKSAMMTTAYDLKSANGGVDSNPFNQGAGHVDPTKFFNPGVVFESDEDDWYSYIAGQGAAVPASAGTTSSIDASDLNVASLAIGDLAGVQTVKRAITDVSGARESYRAAYSGSGAITVSFDQTKYTVPARGSVPVTMTVRATGTSYGEYAKGFVTLTGDKGHVVRIPVAVLPVKAKAPTEVSAQVSTGSTTLSGVSGFDGQLGTKVTGLVGVTPDPGAVATGASAEHTVEVPAGSDYVRFDLDADDNGDDLDLVVYLKNADGTRKEVGASATGAADEQVNFENLPAGTYVAEVLGYSLATGSDGSYSFAGLPVPGSDSRNLTLNPASQSVTANQPFTIEATWSLDATKRYLGRVQYLQNGAPTGVYTVVSLTTG